ncbi:MAG TPA: hypothetical protein VJC07_01665 [Candidatus Nanoarchaeia archaeon]|nr:hypothetical protein [Candidatus Nanoarchaeia archaeon]
MATIFRLENAYSPEDIEDYFDNRDINDLEERIKTMQEILRGDGTEEACLRPISTAYLRIVPPPVEIRYAQLLDSLARDNIARNYARNPQTINAMLSVLDDSSYTPRGVRRESA